MRRRVKSDGNCGCFRSTRATATIAGFIAGGTGGVGSARWGVLRDRGNISALEVVTAEDTPRILELRGTQTALVHHGYGTNCIITEVELPLAHAWEWRETIVAFPTYMQAVRCGVSLGLTTGIVTKLLSVHEWPTPRLIQPLAGIVPEGHIDAVELRGVSRAPRTSTSWSPNLAERSCRHAVRARGPTESRSTKWRSVMHWPTSRKASRSRTAIEGFFHGDDLVELVERVHRKLNGIGPMRMELRRWGTRLGGSGSPYVLFESEEQLVRVARIMQSEGAGVANSHASNVRAVGKKEVTEQDIAFKRSCDPYGLLNPGRFEADSAEDEDLGSNLPVSAWVAQREAARELCRMLPSA